MGQPYFQADGTGLKLLNCSRTLNFLEYQEEETQRKFKVSYYMDPGKDRLAAIHNRLLHHRCRYNLIYSHDRYLDILPYRASKGKAIRYLSYKWEIPLVNFLVCGDSGNDEEMLRGEPRAVVVANYSHELADSRAAGRSISQQATVPVESLKDCSITVLSKKRMEIKP
jgi:sucrose-phosphate synthase